MAGSRTLKLSILADVDDLKKKLDTGANEVEGFGGKLEKFGKVAAAAFAAAAVAAGAYATKLAIDGVKAAIEDEAAQVRLAEALKNATGATEAQIAATEKQITKIQLATGVSDTQLRPAMARLALSTNDVAKSTELLNLALDISQATGKPLEGVANALGKAYDGNAASLAKLGIGLSTAELKTMSFQETQQRLTDLFGGAAAANAETFQGRMARLSETFNEAKENVGAKLLPVIQSLVEFVVNKVVPNLEKFALAFKPITDAVERNKDTFTDFAKFIVTYIVPVITTVLGGALTFLGKIAGGIIDVIADVINFIKSAVSIAIDGINILIRAYNAIPLLPNISTIAKPSVSSVSISAPSVSTPSFTAPTITAPSSSGVSSASASASSAAAAAVVAMPMVSNTAASDYAAFRAGERGDTYNVTVNGALDSESTARQIIEVLNQSAARGTGGGNNFAVAMA